MGHDTADTLVPPALLSTSSKKHCVPVLWHWRRRKLARDHHVLVTKTSHFTLVDLKTAVFARDLLVFRLLFDADSELKSGKDNEETILTLSYLYGAQAMPKWAFDKLRRCISAVLAELNKTSQNPMCIFYIPDSSRKRIARVIQQWQQPPKPWYTSRALRHAARSQFLEQEFKANGKFDELQEQTPPGCDKNSPDERVYRDLFVMLPQEHMLQKHEPQLFRLYKAYNKSRSPNDRKPIEDYLDANWHPNITLIDLDYETRREDGPEPTVDFTPRGSHLGAASGHAA